ncbi:MAG TPA: 1,4-beta-xylanase [Candidatus Dormibacteraeota bacterium]|nr:1,4-beta-xylanase [Candidatus Dormibacteraeota bacterium]
MIERWSRERVGAWYDAQPWMLGFNYLPRTAVNWTELWQAESFDLATIEQELDWARRIGFNALRTNLQYLVWQHDPAGTVTRLDRFLGAAARRGMRTMLCLFDDCAFSGREPYLGPQDPPLPGLHNSGGAASPGRAVVRDRAAWPALERYVKDLVGSFRDDARLIAFDLYNEPGNEMVFTRTPEPHPDGPLAPHSVELAEHAFRWAREAGATQPLTTGVWDRGMEAALARRLLDASDFVSFHDYLPLANVAEQVAALRAEGRPIVCTEWLARGLRSLPETHLPFFARERVGAFHWGLVNGRTQTHRPWPGLAPFIPDDGVWHHDLLHADGTAYDEREIALFRSLRPPRA